MADSAVSVEQFSYKTDWKYEGTVLRTRDDGSGKLVLVLVLVTGPAVHRPQVEDLGICPLGALIF